VRRSRTRVVCVAGVAAVLSALAACSSLKVSHETDPSADLGSYRSFEMVPSKSIVDPAVARGVEGIVADELVRKGLTRVDSGGDLLVACDGGVGNREQVAAGLGYAVETFNGETTVYTVGRGVPVGVLVISLIDHRTGKVAWQGSGSKAVMQGGDPKVRVERLESAVRAILASYPKRR
jgi:hypothetical protein